MKTQQLEETQSRLDQLSVALRLSESMVEELRRKAQQDQDQSEDRTCREITELTFKLKEAQSELNKQEGMIAQNKIFMEKSVEESGNLRSELYSANERTR